MGDVEEALGAATAIGDDTLQRRAGGRVTPETFSHGTGDQRLRWFKRGMDTADPRSCDTFAAAQL
jgi:predicted metalloprotease